jgi:hypothetical protein
MPWPGPGAILQDMTRPNPLLWICYTFSGKLGPHYREWVLHDVNCRTHWLCQTVRAVVQISVPAAVVSVALTALGFGWLSSAGSPAGRCWGLWYSLAYIGQTGDRRLVKNGYEPAAEERAARALRPRARRPDRPLHAELSEGCRLGQARTLCSECTTPYFY